MFATTNLEQTMTDLSIGPAVLTDLPRLTEIHNHYVIPTHITFDIQPFRPEQREGWFCEHSEGGRYRLLVGEKGRFGVLGYVTTGRFRTKAAYDTTVEASIACYPSAAGQDIGTQLYQALFESLAGEDINRVVAGIAQPNEASNALDEKFGFKKVGTFTSVGRKFGKHWDVLWMERPLTLSYDFLRD
jgi:phosphinothricin acetyltransferase